MTYDEIKTALVGIAKRAYTEGTDLNDVRAALHAADLLVEMWAVIEGAVHMNRIAADLTKVDEK